jgi:hypothetical protein
MEQVPLCPSASQMWLSVSAHQWRFPIFSVTTNVTNKGHEPINDSTMLIMLRGSITPPWQSLDSTLAVEIFLIRYIVIQTLYLPFQKWGLTSTLENTLMLFHGTYRDVSIDNT